MANKKTDNQPCEKTLWQTADKLRKNIKENTTLKGVLPKGFAKPNLDKQSLGQLIDLVGKIALGDAKSRAKDVLGRLAKMNLAIRGIAGFVMSATLDDIIKHKFVLPPPAGMWASRTRKTTASPLKTK